MKDQEQVPAEEEKKEEVVVQPQDELRLDSQSDKSGHSDRRYKKKKADPDSEPPKKKKAFIESSSDDEKRSRTKKQKRKARPSSSESDERPVKKTKKKRAASSSDEPSVKRPKKSKKKSKRKASSDSSSGSSEQAVKGKKKSRRKARSSSSESDEQPAKKMKKRISSSSESSDNKPKKKAKKRRVSSSSDDLPKKKSSKKKQRRSPSSSSDDKKKSKKKKRKPSPSSSSSSEDSSSDSSRGNFDFIRALRRILPNLPHKLSINDFMTLDYKFDRNAALDEIREGWENHRNINSLVLASLLLYQVKNKASFQAILDDLDIEDDEEEFCLSPAVMFSFLLENSDSDLQTFLFNACSQYMPIPLYGRRYFSGSGDRFDVWEQSICVYEKYLSVLVLNFENLKKNSPVQTTEVINKILGKEFYVSEFEEVDHGSYQLQFDRNCSDPKFSVVVMKFGFASADDLQSAVVSKAFDIVFINYLSESEKDQRHLENLVDKALDNSDHAKVYSLVQTTSKRLSGLKEQGQAWYRFTKPYQTLGKKVDKLCMSCWADLKSDYFDKESSAYETNFKERWASKDSLISFLEDRQYMTKYDVRHLNFELEAIQEFVELIIECEEEIKGPEMLPMNYYHNKLSKKNIKLKEGVGTYSHQKISQLEDKISSVQAEISRSQPTELLDAYMNLLQKQGLILKHQLMMTNLLSGLYQLKIAPIREKWKKAEAIEDFQERAQMEKKLKKEEMKVMFSLELLPRELYFLSRYRRGDSNRIFMDTYSEYVSSQIQSAQPIELIDGDNLLINDISQAIDMLCKNYIGPEDKITVISIVGPQSSGKSLLLKFLFGTQFFSSEGRCTKGVYFSLLRMKVDEDKNEYILLLDTEGIQSSEGRDQSFDSRIIFFIMCVSNIVLICNKQEVNAPMMNTLNLVIDNWVNARAEVSSSPSIFVVMNKLTGLNQKLIDNSARDIKKNLDLESKLDDDHKLGAFKVFGIPTFFQGQDFGPNMDQLRPVSKEFLQYVQVLRRAITDQCLQNPSKETLPAWFHRTKSLWQTTDDFTGVHQYTSLAEKNEDQQLIQKVNDIVQRHLNHGPESECFKEIQQSLNRILDSERAGTDIILKRLQSEIKKLFQKYRNSAEAEFDEQTTAQKMNFTKKLIQKRKTTIEHYSKSYENKVALYFRYIAMRDVIKKSQKYGFDEMHDEVQAILHGGRSIEQDEAKIMAEKMFERSIHKMYDKMRMQNCFDDINEFIREEFNRIKPELERSNTEMEKQGRQQLLSYGLQGLQQFFIVAFKGASPLTKIGQMKPSKESLLKLSQNNSPFLKVPKSLFVLEKQEVTFNKARIVHLLQQALIQSEDGLPYIAVALHKARKSLDKLMEVLKGFNKEIYRINLVFEPSAKMVQAMIVNGGFESQLSSSRLIQDISTSLIASLSSPESYTLADPSIFPSAQRRKRKKDGPFFVNLENDSAYKILEQCSSVQRNYLDASEQFETNQPLNCTVNPKANLDSGLMEFLKSLCGHRSINNLKSNQVQKAIDFSRLDEVFSKIEVIVCKQILNQSGGKHQSSQVLDNALKNLKMPNDITADITVAINEAKKVRSRADKNGICEYVLSTIQAKVIDVLDGEYRDLNLQLSPTGVSSLVTYAHVIMARVWELKEMVEERTPIFDHLKQKENAVEHAVARLCCNDKKIDETSAKIIVSHVIRSLMEKGQVIAMNSFRDKINAFIEHHDKKSVFKEIENEAYDLAIKVSKRPFQEMTSDEKASSLKMVHFYLNPTDFLEDRAIEDFNYKRNEFLKQTLINYQETYIKNLETFKLFMTDFIKRLKKTLSDKAAFEIFCLNDDSNLKDPSIVRRGLATYFKEYASRIWRNGNKVQVKANQEILTLKQREGKELPFSNDYGLHSQVIDGITTAIGNSFEISNLSTFAEYALVVIEKFESLGPGLMSDTDIIQDSLNKLKNQYSGCMDCCPICNRQCDQNHPVDQHRQLRRHNCETGHQMSCYGGFFNIKSKEATTKTCEDFANSDMIEHNGEVISFSSYKAIHYMWTFSSPNSYQKLETQRRGIKIWNYVVGKRLSIWGGFDFIKAKET